MWELNHKVERRRIDAFELWCWRRLLRVNPTSPKYSLEGLMLKLKSNIWTWCKELSHLKRPWCWERLKAGGEGNNRGWDGWMASLTWWTWVCASLESWWWTGKPGVLQSMGSQRVRNNWWTINFSKRPSRYKSYCPIYLDTLVSSNKRKDPQKILQTKLWTYLGILERTTVNKKQGSPVISDIQRICMGEPGRIRWGGKPHYRYMNLTQQEIKTSHSSPIDIMQQKPLQILFRVCSYG